MIYATISWVSAEGVINGDDAMAAHQSGGGVADENAVGLLSTRSCSALNIIRTASGSPI